MIHCRAVDWNSQEDQASFISLLRQYMADPMGEAKPLSEEGCKEVLSSLSAKPQAYAFFVFIFGIPAGYLLAFQGYSTFRAGDCYNIHDFFVCSEYRGKGLGSSLMDFFILWAEKKGALKLTLEVRDDNLNAQGLYRKFGFGKTSPEMFFFTKNVNKID